MLITAFGGASQENCQGNIAPQCVPLVTDNVFITDEGNRSIILPVQKMLIQVSDENCPHPTWKFNCAAIELDFL